MTWLHVGNAALSVALALGVAYEAGAKHQEDVDLPRIEALHQQLTDGARHDLITDRDTTYWRTADAMGLQYFNALRTYCLPERRP